MTAIPSHDAPPSATARAVQRRAQELIPGGCHTYAKGDDQFPENAPPMMARGRGARAWDLEGREYIEYGMGLRAVTLGHAYPPVVAAAKAALDHGVNFTRPAPIEPETWRGAIAVQAGPPEATAKLKT